MHLWCLHTSSVSEQSCQSVKEPTTKEWVICLLKLLGGVKETHQAEFPPMEPNKNDCSCLKTLNQTSQNYDRGSFTTHNEVLEVRESHSFQPPALFTEMASACSVGVINMTEQHHYGKRFESHSRHPNTHNNMQNPTRIMNAWTQHNNFMY